MQILDFSQTLKAAIFVDSAAKECCKNPSDDSKNLIKHFVFNMVRNVFSTHKAKYGQMIIACDYKSWRRDVFPNYKYKRRENKEKDTSGIDWDFVNKISNEIIRDLSLKFPFPVIIVNKAEGDDIIGVLTKHITMNPTTVDIFDNLEPDPILIISSDTDNFQLHKYKNVKQWSPLEKKLVRPEISWKHSLIEKIVKGDTGDGVMNIKSPDDVFVTGTRQKAIATKYLNEFIESSDPISVCLTEEERKNYVRNEMLVSYDKIPDHIVDSILTCYNQQVNKKHSNTELMNYFAQNKMKNLYGAISDFYL